MEGLTNRQQALLMAIVFMLPPLITWAGLGLPTDRVSLGLLISAILSGVFAFIKELLGGKAPEPKPSSSAGVTP